MTGRHGETYKLCGSRTGFEGPRSKSFWANGTDGPREDFLAAASLVHATPAWGLRMPPACRGADGPCADVMCMIIRTVDNVLTSHVVELSKAGRRSATDRTGGTQPSIPDAGLRCQSLLGCRT